MQLYEKISYLKRFAGISYHLDLDLDLDTGLLNQSCFFLTVYS